MIPSLPPLQTLKTQVSPKSHLRFGYMADFFDSNNNPSGRKKGMSSGSFNAIAKARTVLVLMVAAFLAIPWVHSVLSQSFLSSSNGLGPRHRHAYRSRLPIVTMTANNAPALRDINSQAFSDQNLAKRQKLLKELKAIAPDTDPSPKQLRMVSQVARPSTIVIRHGKTIDGMSMKEALKQDPYLGYDKRFQYVTGSGTIVHKNGIILTNAHVIEKDPPTLEEVFKAGGNPPSEPLVVTFRNGKSAEATVLYQDDVNDIAFIYVSPHDIGMDALPDLPFSDREPELMQTVVTVGNPAQLNWTSSYGHLSAKERHTDTDPDGPFYQLAMDLSPGHSGSGLLNINAQVAGLNTAISERGQGIGFAVPLDRIINAYKLIQRQYPGLFKTNP